MSAYRTQNSSNFSTIAPWLNDQANALLHVQWSPEQIPSRLLINHETVNQHVYAVKAQGLLWKNLRW